MPCTLPGDAPVRKEGGMVIFFDKAGTLEFAGFNTIKGLFIE
jgi:hypothetical protein